MDHVDDAVARYQRGDVKGAEAALRRAIDSGDPDAAGEAGIKLGIMHRRAGDLPRAAEAYRAAAAGGRPEKAQVATFLLAGVLEKQSRFTEAADAYQRVADAGGEQRPAALSGLAELYRFDLDDTAAATRAYREAVDTGDEDIAPRAMVGLAELASTPDEATALYERAAATDHPEAAPRARRALREYRKTPMGDPGSRHAEGVDGCLCLLVLDSDGAVTGLWFEDADIGDAHATDIEKVKGVLIANGLTSMLSTGYRAASDPHAGGYRITFQP